MTDEAPATAQTAPKKPPSGAGPHRSNKKSVSGPKPAGNVNSQGPPRPNSGAGGRKPSSATGGTDSGSDTAAVRKASDSGKKAEQRNKNQSVSQRAPAHRKGQPSASQATRSNSNNATKDTSANKPSPNPSAESSEAMSSLQRMIADLKTTTSPPIPSNSSGNFGMAGPAQTSNLPVNAPVFQPGAAAYPGPDMKHRKAASSGPGLSGNFNSFAPGLGAMMEDAEDGSHLEDGEIHDHFPHPTHQPRSQSQSFMAPRFAALAQQEDSVGPTGRPQLAPGFMFGARKQQQRPPSMGPPINEEDLGFQFPQQQQQQPQQSQPAYQPERPTHGKTESQGEITGIMAEQVRPFTGH